MSTRTHPGSLGVVGNISRDRSSYPDNREFHFLGGGALHIAYAASQVGLTTTPISVIGADLSFIKADPRLSLIDFSSVRIESGPSCAFHMRYNEAGELAGISCAYGVASALTAHAQARIGELDHYHICCRRPLDIASMLKYLDGRPFSLDFFVSSVGDLIDEAAPFLTAAKLIVVNVVEFEWLRTRVDVANLASVIVSDGAEYARLMRRGELVAAAKPMTAAALEVTGAGDTLTGAFLGYQAAGYGDTVALELAVRMATDSVATARLLLSDDAQGNG